MSFLTSKKNCYRLEADRRKQVRTASAEVHRVAHSMNTD